MTLHRPWPPAARIADRLRRYPVLQLAAVSIPLLLLFTAFTLHIIQNSHTRNTHAHLQTTLNTVIKQVEAWRQRNIDSLRLLRDTERGQRLLQDVLQGSREYGNDVESRSELEQWLYPLLAPLGYEGYFVLDMERRVVAAASRAYLGDRMTQPEIVEVLDQALQHNPGVSRPVDAMRGLRTPKGMVPPHTLMQNTCILVESGSQTSPQPMGYFCLRIDPHQRFFPIFEAARSGTSGDAFAMDAQGWQMTPGRHATAPRDGPPDQALALRQISVREPASAAREGPLTRIAARLMDGQGKVAETDYRNARGEASIGVGHWIAPMNMGVIVEQSMDEAFAPYRLSRTVITGLATGALLLILLLTTGAVVSRRKLMQRETRFRTLLDNIPAPVCMTDLAGTLTLVNPAFSQLIQIDPAHLPACPLGELNLPRYLQPLFAGDTCEKQGCHEDTCVIRRPDGSQQHYRRIRFAVHGGDRQAPLACATLLLDITEQASASQRLEQLVQERTAELTSARELALNAAHNKAAFLASMSHEIRTPLTAIIGMTGLALSSHPPEPARNYLGKILASGEHLLQIINDILDISRFEAGKLSLDHSGFSLRQVVERVVDLVWERATAKGLELRIDLDERIPPVLLGDPLRLGQILINLVTNAVKFTDHGHICIRAIHHHSEDDQEDLSIEVEDTGIGMAPEALAALFQPFHQVDQSSTRRFEGSGLGLAICKNLAELMHAQLDVTSREGMGSCFRLQLRLQRGHGLRPDDPPSPPDWVPLTSCANGGYRVLLVEDDRINQELAEALLRQLGVNVTTANNGLEAVDAVRQHPFDVVLMDVQMPKMDGFAATRAIRHLPGCEQLPIIAMTANALPDDRQRCLDAGMNEYLVKPVEPARLGALLGRVCRPQPKPHSSIDQEFSGLQQAGIDTAQALSRLMGDGGLYRYLLHRFVEERADLPGQLDDDWRRSDWGAIRSKIHSLKSLAGSLGMTSLQQAAIQFEQQLRNGSASKTGLDNLNRLLAQTTKLVRTRVAG